MIFSQGYKIMWFTGIFFLILPHFNLGLLSDYKICGDSECESLMSRVQATRDHLGKDCRFLSFRRGDTIFVYHKLTGKRDDLWAGTIDRQFGYFPKDAVQEEQVYATMEKVVETQKSDFICMNEFGYPMDSSHLDNDDDAGDNHKIQNQGSETTQTNLLTNDTSTENSSAESVDSFTQSPVSVQQLDGTSAGDDEKENAGGDAAKTQEEAHETPAAMSEQGGSPSSSWLGYSVTGWLGLGKEGQPGNLAEREKNDERREIQAEASLSSSVKGWLGLGGEGKPDHAVNNREEEEKTAASFTSTMTGWLDFRGETKTDSTEKEEAEEREMDDDSEPKETFRSRRMSLDLEGSHLHEEEKKEMATLDWLGNGLSSTLGFGLSNQEPEIIKEEKEKPVSNSWLNIGVEDILGFRNYKSENSESTGKSFEETDKDKTLEQATAFGNADTSQIQPAQAEKKAEPDIQRLEEKAGTKAVPEEGDHNINICANKDTDISNVEENDQFPQSKSEFATLATEDFNNNKIDVSDSSKDSVLPDDAAAGVDQKDISPQSNREESSLPIDEFSSRTNEEKSAETVGEGQQIPTSIENKGESNGVEEIKTVTQPNYNLELEPYSIDIGQSIAKVEEGNTDQVRESVEEDGAKIMSKADNTEESIVASFGIGASSYSHENDRRNAEMDLIEIATTQTDDLSEQSQDVGNEEENSGISQSSFIPSSDAAKEEYEPTHSEDKSVTDADILDTEAMTDDNIGTKTETPQGELVHIGEVHLVESSSQKFESSPSSNSSIQSLYENIKEDTLSQDVKVDNTDHDFASPETLSGAINELKAKEKQREAKKEQKQEEIEELNEKEMFEDLVELKGEERQEFKEEKQYQVKEEDKQGGVEKGKTEQKTQEVEELKNMEKQDEVAEITDVEKVREEQRQEKKKELEEEKLVEVEVLKEEKKQEEELEKLKDEENIKELKEEVGQKERENEEVEEKWVQLSHLEILKKNTHDVGKPESESNVKERHNEDAKTEWAEEEKREEEMTKQEKVEEVKEEKMEVEETQQVNNVEGEMKKEDDSLKCPNEVCLQATEDESARDINENISEQGPSSAEEATSQGVKENSQILVDGAGEIVEKDRLSEEEKNNTPFDGTANKVGKNNNTLNTIESEHIYSNNANSISDHSGLEVEQIGETKYKENDLHFAGEGGHNGHTNEMFPIQKHSLKKQECDHLAEKKDLSDDEGYELQLKDNDRKHPGETSSNWISTDNTHFEHKLESLSLTSDSEDKTQTEPTLPHEFPNPTASSLPPDEHDGGTGEDKRTGAFGLFKNAISFFSQTTVTESKNISESSSSSDTNTDEMPESEASLTTAQKSDSTTDSSEVSEGFQGDLNEDSTIAISTQQHTQRLHSSELHSHLNTPTPHAGTLLQTKALSKLYKNLLSHVSVEEMSILIDLFGPHKMQFLDYILGSSETVANDPDNNESILSDVERLLHYHRETLVTASMGLTDTPQEDEEKTRKLIALQKLELLLERLKDAFTAGKSDVSKRNLQAEASCFGASCGTHSKDKEESRKTQDFSSDYDTNIRRDLGTENGIESHPRFQPGSPQPLEGLMKQILDFVHQATEDSATHAQAVVSSLPDDIRPGPDLYGVPWEPVIISSLVGLVTVLLFTCRCYSSIKSRMYRRKEQWMVEQVAQLLEEKCKVLETLSKCQQEYDDLEGSLRDSGIFAHTEKTEQVETKARQLEHAKREVEMDLGQLKHQLEQQREHRMEQERRIAVLEESMKTLEEETKDLQSQEEQAQTTLKVYSMNSDRLQKNLETAEEESRLLQESNSQLKQQVEGWAERVSELEAEMRRCEVAYSGMQQDVANKDERIMSLTDCLLRMRAWDSELEEEGEEGGKKEASNGTAAKGEENESGVITNTQEHLQKVQKLIYAAKLNADLKSLDEDKDRVFAKLNDEVKAKEDLQESIKELEKEKLSLQSDAVHCSDEVQRIQQKLQIMTEMYQENELKLHRLLTVEERERLQKEEKLTKADKNIALAIEGVNNYRQRAEEMEEELEKTKQSYQTQISAHEKKAHNNWLAARAAERELADIRRENALIRQKLTDTQFKLDALDKDPYALNTLARPQPFRAERSPYGPSPLGRPASETRPFLSPPTLMDGPHTRLSPRVTCGPAEPPGGQGEMQRSAGPHSDSGSISPTWERDRRGPQLLPPPGPLVPPGPVGPPGYMFPEPGGPMYRRSLLLPGAMGVLPPPGSLPPGPPLPHSKVFPSGAPPGPPNSKDMADDAYKENSLGPSEQGHREPGPGERRTSPEADSRISGPLLTGHPMGHMDFARRTPYRPPHPDFYPPRGPGGPPMRPMWAPPPPGMIFPSRYPASGPPLPLVPHAQFAPPMRLPAPDGLPPPSMGPPPAQQSLPSPSHSQSPEEHTSPEDNI
ncbi:cTAGE family member 5 isoform X2 [Channa argus]|uniref:cTAGE family member 5 isoform X2 n=1 Tax=Channa argus TaxID=215402 RepID=UPI00351FD12C